MLRLGRSRGKPFGLLAAVVLFALPAQAAHGAESAGADALSTGDGRITDGPRRGWAFACTRGKDTRPPAVPWIDGRSFDPELKPTIDGNVRWPRARFRLLSGDPASFNGNGQPAPTRTGVFPPRTGDDAAQYVGTAAALIAHGLAGTFPRSPSARTKPACISAAKPVAIALNGVPILPAFNRGGIDLAAHDVRDRCGGRTDSLGRYYYRAGAPCLLKGASPRTHSRQIGFARDGFPLYGPRGGDGAELESSDLDDCHGHAHVVTFRGRRVPVYHYHSTADFPYTVGCFHGEPADDWRRSTKLRIRARSIYPRFTPDVTDYIARCEAGKPLEVSVGASEDKRVSVDGRRSRTGAFSTPVALTAGQEFTLRARIGGKLSTHHVRCVPPDFPRAKTRPTSGTPQAEWYMLTLLSYAAIFDKHGVPVWWTRTSPLDPIDLRLLPNGNLAWARYVPQTGIGLDDRSAFVQRRIDGSFVRQLKTVGSPTDFHDLVLLANGNYLMVTYRRRDGVDLSPYGGPSNATVLDAEVQEVTPAGSLVWSWNSKDHVHLSETDHWYDDQLIDKGVTLPDGTRAYDLVHINSAEPRGDRIIISLRHTDAVYEISRSTGKIVWKLGGTATPESLSIVGDSKYGSTSFGGQHDARVLPDGTLTVHDNGIWRNRPPRALRFRIDRRAKTATLLEQVVDPDIPTSFCCGSSRKLPGGNWVVSWGQVPHVMELTPSGRRVFHLHIAFTVFSYRAFPLLPGQLERSQLRRGMNAMHPRRA